MCWGDPCPWAKTGTSLHGQIGKNTRPAHLEVAVLQRTQGDQSSQNQETQASVEWFSE